MSIKKVLEKSALQIEVEAGVDPSGVVKVKNYTFDELNVTAPQEKVLETGADLAALIDHPLRKIKTVEVNVLLADEAKAEGGNA